MGQASQSQKGEFYLGFEITAEDTVVDVGCGDGVASLFAGNLGAEVIATDSDSIVIDRLNARMQNVPARSYQGIVSDSNPLPLPDGMADVVLCTEVLEHVDDPPSFVAELTRIGKPGARYLISVPHPTSEAVMQVVAPRWYWEAPYHRHVYEPARFDALLEASGLKVEARDETGFYWSLWWFFRMALGAEPYASTPNAPLLHHWEATWKALAETPQGAQVAQELDRMVPKSQVRIARKVGGPTALASSFVGPVWSRPRWKRLVRNGGLRLGGFDVRWNVRRASKA